MGKSKKKPRGRIYSQTESPEAYSIREFLNCSVINFDFVEINSDEEAKRELGKSLNEIKLPVVEFPDGTKLEAPTMHEIAQQLGWKTKPSRKEYDLSIYGAGPAGLSASVYAASEGLKTILIEKHSVGGQAGTSSLIENYLGFPKGISGAELAERAREQAIKFGTELILLQEGIKAEFRDNKIHVETSEGDWITAHANICATGVTYRRLGVENEKQFLNKGLYYGAGSSEAPFCTDDHVFVVGGGNSAGQATLNFSNFSKQVTMVVRSKDLAESLSKYLVDRIKDAKNVDVMYEACVTGLNGNDKLEEIEITQHKKVHKCKTGHLFVCIGGEPNTEWAKEVGIVRDNAGYLVTGPDLYINKELPSNWKAERHPYFLETSIPGCFAAGDVRHNSVKRVASAVGEGAMAVTFVHKYLKEMGFV
jgi:thioredoxin reductase (NADPH)